MASIGKESGGFRILFVAPDGKRKTLRLGKVSRHQAVAVKVKIETLVAAAFTGHPPDDEVSRWVAAVGDELADKLAAVGLVPKRQQTTVKGLATTFCEAHPDAKPATFVVWGQVARCLCDCFSEARAVRTITREDAEGFRQWLLDQKLSATTVHKRLQFARQFFTFAVRHGLIDRNPFEGVGYKAGSPSERQHYVTPEDTERLIAAAPNWIWRTIIALARYGGLRTPSETLSLRLEDLDWEHGAINVSSPKTEGCGHGRRLVPMFARLRPHLDEAWDAAEERQTHVIPEGLYLPASNGPHGWVNVNLRTTFEKIVRRAGLDPWPRLFHALRASCESDLAREYPITTVCKWIGNTVAIAARHYVQVTDDDFRRASGAAKQAAQNPAQQTSELAHKAEQENSNTPVFPGNAKPCDTVQMYSGGGGNRTRVPRHFRGSFYVRSRMIYAFAQSTPNRRGAGPASRARSLVPGVPDGDPERAEFAAGFWASSAKARSRGYVYYAASARLLSAIKEFGQLLTWPTDQPRHATPTSNCPVEPSSPPGRVEGVCFIRHCTAGGSVFPW